MCAFLSDGEQPHLSTTSSPVKRPKKTATKRRHDESDDESDDDGCTLLESLRNKGDWQHNIKVLEEGNGEIVTWRLRRPTEKAH